MTLPIAHGFPDWARQSAAADLEVIYLENSNITAQTTYPTTGAFFVGIAPFLRVFQSAAGLRTKVELQWWADEAKTRDLGSDILVTASGGSVAQSIPVRAPYVSIVVDLSAYPNQHSLQVFMVPAAISETGQSTGDITLISVDAASVAAAATRTDNASRTRGGWAYWQGIFDDGVNGLIRLYSVDFTGAVNLLDTMGPGISTQGRLVFLPAMPIRVTSQNADGSARNLYLTVLYRPFAV